MPNLEVIGRQLRKHAARRDSGIATLSLIIGQPTDCLATLRSALAQLGRYMVAVRGSVETLARTTLSALDGGPGLLGRALESIASALNEPPERIRAAWAARSAHERSLWLTQLASNNPTTRAVVDWFAAQRAEQSAPSSVASLLAVEAWWPSKQMPGLCLAVEDNGWSVAELIALCIDAPRLTLLAIISPLAWHHLAPTLSSRYRCLLEEGMLEFSEKAFPEEPTSQVHERRARTAPLDPAALATLYANAAQAQRAVNEVTTPSVEPTPSEAQERARSLAELLLYELLQADEETRDLFELNGELPFVFGSRAAEIDLLSRALHIAVEVDGYFHFGDPDAYRRDRRKDVLLQSNAFFISRHLASDVVGRSHEVVRAIKDIVKRQKGLPDQRGGFP